MKPQIEPEQIDNALRSAQDFARKGQFREAIDIANQVIHRYRSDPRGWYLLSDINFRCAQYVNAVECADRAVALKPGVARYQIQLGRCLAMAGHKNRALEVAGAAAALKPVEASFNDAIAAIYSICDDQDRALPFIVKAVEADPANSMFRYNLAAIQRMMGKLDEAEANCDRVIADNPQDYKAYYTRADLRTWTNEHNHVEAMERLLLEGVAEWRSEMVLRFALAKECEDIGDYERSFRYTHSACDLQRRHMSYEVEEDLEIMSAIREGHAKHALSDAQGCQNREPIFVMGLPRTGTSLAERILSSHTQVYSAGELNNFATQMVTMVHAAAGGASLTKQEMVAKSLQLDFAALGDAYLESTRPRTGATAHFIDKQPQNYLYAGLIHCALPEARMIVLDRNPMDACYAIYKTMFTAAYPFSYDLTDLGKYYVAYRQLLAHWADLIGEDLMILRYEELVSGPEASSRGLVAFCSLPWEEACLEFHKSETAASTASAVQVRRPVYTSSVGKWRHYESQLAPLAEFLESHGVAI